MPTTPGTEAAELLGRAVLSEGTEAMVVSGR
jgi:hypothetical protein